MTHWPEPISLEGRYVAVEPLSAARQSELEAAAADSDGPNLWYTSVPGPDGVAEQIERRVARQKAGSLVPFAVICKMSGELEGQAVGTTNFFDPDPENRRLEIGGTWYRKGVQRTPVNTECKLLLMTHCFESLNCIAVEFRTHFMNHQSRAAIERLGAKLDGVLRAHRIMPNGTLRDTAVYSITAYDWPAVKANLEWKLEKPR